MTEPLRVCLIGLGPRGLSVLERLCANASDLVAGGGVAVHVVDPHPPGPGRVWRTSQHRRLLMNTVASQVTMFTDDSVTMAGPVRGGPSLAEWANFLTLMGPLEDYDDWVYQEAQRIGPDTYSTRAFYGQYLRWVFWRVLSQAPPNVRVVVHRSHVVDLYENPMDGSQRAVLADGTRIDSLDAVVLAQGHVPTTLSAREEALASFARANRLRYVAPINPADVDLSVISPGAPVMLAGLGLCFFDHMALLTTGRGGVFERVDGELRYRPSGREPRIYASSRRGVPYHSRGDNQKGAFGRHIPVVLTAQVIADLRARAEGGLDFKRDLWPLIAKEVETVYYTTVVSTRGCACDVERFRARMLAVPWGSAEEAELLEHSGVTPEERWDWAAIEQPLAGRHFPDPAAFRSWMIDYLRHDVAQARLGNVDSPLKAALDVLRDLRNEVRLAVDHGGLTGRSHRQDLDGWYTPLNAFLSIGPPVQRTEEALALIEAGVLDLIGPHITVECDPAGHFVVESPAVDGSRVAVRTLIEARLGEPDLRRTVDPLLRRLYAAGEVSIHQIPDGAGAGDALSSAEEPVGVYETGGLAVTERPYRLLNAAGRPHPRRYAFGVPTESVHWVTAAGIRPGVDSVTLGDADAIARQVLELRGRTPADGLADGLALVPDSNSGRLASVADPAVPPKG